MCAGLPYGESKTPVSLISGPDLTLPYYLSKVLEVEPCAPRSLVPWIRNHSGHGSLIMFEIRALGRRSTDICRAPKATGV